MEDMTNERVEVPRYTEENARTGEWMDGRTGASGLLGGQPESCLPPHGEGTSTGGEFP